MGATSKKKGSDFFAYLEMEAPELVTEDNVNFNDSVKNLLKNTNINDINALFLQSHGVSKEHSEKIMQEKNGLSNNECIHMCGNLRKVLCVPCGHLCLCIDCYQKKHMVPLPEKCPFCGIKADNFVTLSNNIQIA